jgi:hypothetical protein
MAPAGPGKEPGRQRPEILLEKLQGPGVKVVHHDLANAHDGGKDYKGNPCQ